jgi:hypothetical protein
VSTRRVVAAVAVAGVALVGCASEDDGALDLTGDDGSAAASETEPPAEVTEDPDPPPPDDDDEPLYPPLPPLEPDPDSDIPEDEQRHFLDLYERYHQVALGALAGGSVEEDSLEEVAAHGELDALEERLGSYREEGVVLSFVDTRASWVRVVRVEGGQGIVQECRIDGPGSGRVDVATGEPVGERTPGDLARIIQARFELVEIGDGTFDHRVVEVLDAADEELCGV